VETATASMQMYTALESRTWGALSCMSCE